MMWFMRVVVLIGVVFECNSGMYVCLEQFCGGSYDATYSNTMGEKLDTKYKVHVG